jgi:hypothetical protein
MNSWHVEGLQVRVALATDQKAWHKTEHSSEGTNRELSMCARKQNGKKHRRTCWLAVGGGGGVSWSAEVAVAAATRRWADAPVAAGKGRAPAPLLMPSHTYGGHVQGERVGEKGGGIDYFVTRTEVSSQE